jgi:uncharacterized protein YutD
MNERDLRMGEWNNRRQRNMKVRRRRQTFKTAQYIYEYCGMSGVLYILVKMWKISMTKDEI